PTAPDRRRPEHLRGRLPGGSYLLNQVHTADEPADALRELGSTSPPGAVRCASTVWPPATTPPGRRRGSPTTSTPGTAGTPRTPARRGRRLPTRGSRTSRTPGCAAGSCARPTPSRGP